MLINYNPRGTYSINERGGYEWHRNTQDGHGGRAEEHREEMVQIAEQIAEEKIKAMVPQMMEMIPEFLVALGTARPRPYAAKGPAQRIPKANVFMATIDTPNREISMATTADSTLQARV